VDPNNIVCSDKLRGGGDLKILVEHSSPSIIMAQRIMSFTDLDWRDS
jgi:hypothetical protein